MNGKIIITGSLGYIGSELAKHVKASHMASLLIDKEAREGVEGLQLNLCDKERTAGEIKKFKPTLFVHAGTHSALSYRDSFLESFTEDFTALANILQSLAAQPDCRLVYFSSSYVYSGLPTNQKVFEESPLRPNHNFGVAKSFFEQLILRSWPNSIIFRLSSVFGPGQAKHPNTILGFAKECLEKGVITVWGKGERKIQYISIQNVITCVMQSDRLEPGIYNLGGNDYISVAEAAKLISDFYHAKTVFLKEKPEGETLPFLDNRKLKSAFQDELFTPFIEGVKEYLTTVK
ncbi:MAG: NAD(P)-dependent oxidoreductase [Patescibacteria group bacterium]